ncbi:hypothetical protein [Sandaracinus amylolyticus]|uniref:Uncharacterized protein n=1 Tax=Sandaracinus amylolyticus TaxID=927083 RepID=A0A0F6W744_9BACT|nr:hypothetical protein [Sandaracinus amylolyticus]AKF08990.1 hypothetical protein DB32_006139 [Sandaracinus amylolyticus]
MSTLSWMVLGALLAVGAQGCGGGRGDDADGGHRDARASGGDGGGEGSALPVRCPPGADDPVCGQAREDNPIGAGPRPRAQVGLTPMLTGGVLDGETLVIGGSWGGGDALTGAVLEIELGSGDRRALSGVVNDPRTGEQTIGAGRALGQVQDVGVRSDGDVVALSRVSTTRVELVRIARESGDRTVLWYNQLTADGHETTAACTDGAAREIPNVDDSSLAIGPDDEMYVVARPADPSAAAIIAIAADGRSCAITTFDGEAQPPGANRGSGPKITGGMRGLRYAGGRLYGTDAGVSSLIAIDVETGDRVVISRSGSSGTVGAGEALGHSRLDVDVAGGRALTIDDELGGATRITEIDLESGDRTTVALVSNTVHAPGEGGVWFHPSRPLYVAVTWSTAIALVDPVSGEGNLISN